MEAAEPPIFIVVPGTVYRRDTIDATHSPMFHQVEGLAVAEGISLADLAGTLEHAAKALFGPERRTRLKPDYFPFTEPSVQVDVSCFACDGTGTLPGGERDPLCKGTGWIEILGAGMVDPNVFGFVEHGYDPETASRGSPSGWGSSGSRCSSTGSPTCACSSRTTSASWSSSHEGLLLLADRVLRPRPAAPRRSPSCSRCGGRGRAGEHGSASQSGDGFVVGRVVSAEQHPDADRLSRLRGRRRRRRPGRSSAAPPTSPPARPSRSRCPARCCPTARS